jgi:hypothetical protein
MNEEIIVEKLEAEAMKSVGGGDMRSLATAWEASATDTNG